MTSQTCHSKQQTGSPPHMVFVIIMKVSGVKTFTFTFMHLADTFIQSDLLYIAYHGTHLHSYQFLLSLGIEP
ncbi:hypothetical protein PO909_003157, partial [Leuciscus waleckii]